MGRWIIGFSPDCRSLPAETTRCRMTTRAGRRNGSTAIRVSCALVCLTLAVTPSSACGPACGSIDRLAQPPALALLVQSASGDLQVADVQGPAGAPVALKIKYREAKPSNNGNLFILRGIPEGMKLNFGGDFGNFWAVNSKVFDRLTLTAESGISGRFQIRVTQAGAAEADKKKAEIFLVTILDTGDTQRTPTAATPAFVDAPQQGRPIAPPPPAAAQTPPNPAQFALMERATSLLALGDVAGARTVFEYLVLRGDAAAAIALGGTYDQAVLGQLFVKGVSADQAKARFWYEKAKEMGNSDANRRLQSLTQK